MSYLLDKKNKNKKISRIITIILVLFSLFYFRSGILRGLSSGAQAVFHPVVSLGNRIGHSFSDWGSLLRSKKSLLSENENLKSQIEESQADRANYLSVVNENNELKEILGRKLESANILVASILSKSTQSVYGTFLIDVGQDQGILVGQRVFAFGNVPIGKISEVYGGSSKVVLYSYPGEKTEVVISGKDAFMQVVGRGGGNFEMILPRDFILDIGAEVVLPGITPYVLGSVSTIISDPRDSFQKALLASPVNIQELKFVEVEK